MCTYETLLTVIRVINIVSQKQRATLFSTITLMCLDEFFLPLKTEINALQKGYKIFNFTLFSYGFPFYEILLTIYGRKCITVPQVFS